MLNWAIIGSGDVVSRLVQGSFNVKEKLHLVYTFQAGLLLKKIIKN